MLTPIRCHARRAALMLLLALLPIGANAQNAYITNSNGGTVSVIDTGSNTVIATIPVGGTPFGVAVTPNGAKVYVGNGGTVSVIDTATNTVTTMIAAGEGASSVAVTPDGTKAYFREGGTLFAWAIIVIDTATDQAVTAISLPTFAAPGGMAVTPDGSKLYVPNTGLNTVSVIHTATNTVISTITVGAGPEDVAVTPDGTKAYVTIFSNNTISVIDTGSNTVIATIPVGSQPFGVAVTPDGTKAYVTHADAGGSTVSVIDTATNTVTTTIPVGFAPRGVAVTPDGTKAYVANFNDNTVSVIATATNRVVATIPVGNGPYALGKFIGGPRHGSPPVAVAETKTTPANTPVTIDLTAGATGNPTSAALVGTPVGGSVSGFPATTVTFTPTIGFTGPASFQFTLANAFGTSNTATATITVTPPPAPSISSVSPNPVTGSDSPQPFTISGANFVSGANVTLRDLTAAQIFPNLVASSFSSTQIVINPIFTTAAHSWSVEVINPDGQSSGQFPFTVIAPPSLPPVAKNQDITATAGVAKTIDLSKNATGGAPTGAKTSKPMHGTISATFGTSVIYTANACYTGPDSFTFRLTNDFGQSNLAKVTITVNPAGAPAVEVHLIDPYLLDAYHTHPQKITETSLFGVYNLLEVQAKGLVADGVSAAIAVVKTNDCSADLNVSTSSNGITLLPYDDKFLGSPPQPGTASVPFTAAELAANGGFAVVLVQAPIGGPASSFADPIIVTAQQGSQTAPPAQADLVPPPVVLVHGIWGGRSTLGGDDGAGTTNGLAHYLKTTVPWSSHPDLVSALCYSKYFGFNAPIDSLTQVSGDSCEQTSKDALTSRIYGLLAYLDSLKIAGSRVDLVAHSMGGLAARNYSAQKWYKNYRNRKQGQFHEIITLDTPEIGSKLASSLIDHKDCHGADDFTMPNYSPVWEGLCDALHTHRVTVTQCFAGLHLPLALDPAHPEDGAVWSLIPPDDPRGKAIKNLLSPKIPSADWRAISATKPSKGALGTVLDGLIKAVIKGNAPPCGPFNTPQTIDGILRTSDNDAIVTLSSQLGGVNDHAPIFQTLSGFSHTGLPDPLYKFICSDCVNDNVPESPAVWQQVCLWLSPNSACLPVAPNAAAAGKNAVPMPHVVIKHPHFVDRLTLRIPLGLELGKPFDLAVNTGSGGLPELHAVQTSQTGTQKEVPVSISRVEGLTVHLNVTPTFFGATLFKVTAAYPDGGVATKEVAANVSLPSLSPEDFHADELSVAGIPLVVAGQPNATRNPILRLQPWLSVSVFNVKMRAYLPDMSKVQFTIDPPSGSSFIALDLNTGIIHPLKIGTATIKAKYTDPTNPLGTLTSQVQVHVVDKQQ